MSSLGARRARLKPIPLMPRKARAQALTLPAQQPPLPPAQQPPPPRPRPSAVPPPPPRPRPPPPKVSKAWLPLPKAGPPRASSAVFAGEAARQKHVETLHLQPKDAQRYPAVKILKTAHVIKQELLAEAREEEVASSAAASSSTGPATRRTELFAHLRRLPSTSGKRGSHEIDRSMKREDAKDKDSKKKDKKDKKGGGGSSKRKVSA